MPLARQRSASAIRRFLCSALVCAVAAGTMSSNVRLRASASQEPPGQALADGIAPAALEQIDALIREKDARSEIHQKIDSQLLYELRMETGRSIADGVFALETNLPYAVDGHVVVDVKAQVTNALIARLTALRVEVLSSDPNNGTLRIHINIDQVEAVAALPGVSFVQPRQDAMLTRWRGPVARAGVGRRAAVARFLSSAFGQTAHPNVLFTQTGQGSRSSEGDITHLAYAARSAFGADGTGIKIGVLSDGVTNLAASQASGDLGPVTVLAGQAGSGDEGTAMLEIVHDLAPGAQLYFATAFTSIASFASNIRALRTAGCDIIVDDVFYFTETPFQDGQAPGIISNTNGGIVIQAVNDVTAAGALYFSSAGNSGNLNAATSGTWEGDFVDGGAMGAPLPAGRVHRFASQNFDVLTVATTNPENLYWSDPLGGSANDYDLFRLNSAGTLVLASSTNIQSGTQDPYEQISGAGAVAGQRIVIVKKTAAASRFLHLSTNGSVLSIATAGEIHGHAGAAAAFGVAAVPAVGPFPQPFNASNVVETFSSDGPRRVFYQANGAAYTPGNLSATGGLLRQKPDVTAADGVSVTGAGGFPSPFFGTSAAAPHAGAIAALLKSASPALTPAQIRTLLMTSAIDIELAGADRDSGAGIVMADGVMRAAGVPAGAFVEVVSVQASDHPGNGNGAPEAGEGASLLIPLVNYGGATATGVTATLTSSTPGITISQPATRTYPDLAISASASAAPYLFTVASTYPCGQPAAFTLAVNYSGGPSPKAFNFQVAIAPPPFSITTTLDAVAPPGSPGVTTTTGTQTRRLNRDGIAAACGAAKAVPPLFTGSGGVASRRYEAYAFNTCATSAPTCVTVTLQGANAINLFSAAYAPTFVSSNVQQNYKADPGVSGSSTRYAFDLAGGAQSFAIDVHEVIAGGGIGTPYTLNVAGACWGSCAPPNQVPVARAKDVTAVADATGTASASIDDGSSDADGDPLTITQSPPGPYPIGLTSVVLTVTDPKGATSQAAATVTVISAPPAISIADVSVPEGHTGTVAAQFHVTLSNVSSSTVTVTFATANQTAMAPSDYAAASGIVSFAPNELDKIVSVLVNGDTMIEGNETFLVNLSGPANASIARGQAVGTILDDDAVDEAKVTQAVAAGAARLQALQRADGGWFFNVGDAGCGAGAGVSCPNTIGTTALGLLAGYVRTGNASLLTAATAAGDTLVARYNAALTATPPALPYTQDIEFLMDVGQLTGNALYSSTAQSWFQIVVNQFPIAADRVDALVAKRDAQHLRSLAAWDSASFIRAAKAVGNAAYALAAATRIRDREVDWKDTNPLHRFDQCPNQNGCGLPGNLLSFDYTILGEGSLLWAIHDLPGFDAQLSEYQSFLLAQQDPAGSWDAGDSQIAAYVVLGLAAVGGAAADAAIQSGAAFFIGNRLPSGGWPSYVGPTGNGVENTEVDAEIVRALFKLFSTPAGSNVSVTPAQLATMTFSTVSTAGLTSVVAKDHAMITTSHSGFELLAGLTYDVITTAGVSGRATVCFSVPWITDASTFANVRILHEERGKLIDRTILGPRRLAPDFATRRVCARVTSLSPFAIVLRDKTPPKPSVTPMPPVVPRGQRKPDR
jgi:hypothetical protein